MGRYVAYHKHALVYPVTALGISKKGKTSKKCRFLLSMKMYLRGVNKIHFEIKCYRAGGHSKQKLRIYM